MLAASHCQLLNVYKGKREGGASHELIASATSLVNSGQNVSRNSNGALFFCFYFLPISPHFAWV